MGTKGMHGLPLEKKMGMGMSMSSEISAKSNFVNSDCYKSCSPKLQPVRTLISYYIASAIASPHKF